MPTYEFKCVKHGVFDLDFTFAEYDELERDDKGNATAPCATPRCRQTAVRQLQLFGNISTSDDPSFGSRPGEHRNREFSGFDLDSKSAQKNDGFTGWAERPKHDKHSWEYAD